MNGYELSWILGFSLVWAGAISFTVALLNSEIKPMILCAIICITGIVVMVTSNSLIVQDKDKMFKYEAELKQGEIVKAKNCETLKNKKYCEVRENKVKSGFFVSSEFIKVVVNDYREVE